MRVEPNGHPSEGIQACLAYLYRKLECGFELFTIFVECFEYIQLSRKAEQRISACEEGLYAFRRKDIPA